MSQASASSDSGVRERWFSDGSDNESEVTVLRGNEDTGRESVSTDADASASHSQSKVKRKSTSTIYKFFTYKEVAKRFNCNYCSLSYMKMKDSSTGNLRKHIRTAHPSLLETGEEPISIKSFLSQTSASTKPESEKFTPEGFKKRLAQVIVKEDQPFSMVESKSWKELFVYCHPEAKLPGSTSIRTEISELFSSQVKNVAQLLKGTPGRISLIIDCWTSKNQYPFLGVIAQWVDVNWEFNYLMLDLKLLEGSHTGKNIAASTWEVIDSFEIQHKIQSITTDNASNMDTFFVEFEKLAADRGIAFSAENNRVRCFAHILNLCCQDAIREVNAETISFDLTETYRDQDIGLATGSDKGIIAKLRKSIEKIRSSPQRRESFRRQCNKLDLDVELTQDVKTRWNTTYDMIIRALKLRQALECVTSADKDLKMYKLTEADWMALELISKFLQPFKDATVFISSEKFPTISYCAMMYNSIFTHFENYEIDSTRNLKGLNPETGKVYPIWLQNAAKAAKSKLEKYYGEADCLSYIIGTVMDPRFKLVAFREIMKLKPAVVKSYKERLCDKWTTTYKQHEAVQKPEAKASSFLAQQLANLNKSNLSDELERYLKEKPVESALLDNGAVGWWKNHECDFPALAVMARDYLSTCGTGVAVERLFSLGPMLLTNLRQKMKPQTIRECIFLKSWLKFKEKHYGSVFSVAVVNKAGGD